MTNTDQVLTREYGIENFTTPTGRKLGVKKYQVNPGLLEVHYADGKGGSLPEELQGLFTKSTLAEAAIATWLNKFWDISDEASKPLAAPVDKIPSPKKEKIKVAISPQA